MAGRGLNLGLGPALGNQNVFDTLRQNTLDKQRQSVVDEQLASSKQAREFEAQDREDAQAQVSGRQQWLGEALALINADQTLTPQQKLAARILLPQGKIPDFMQAGVKQEVQRVSGLTNEKGQRVTRGIDPNTGETKYELPEYVAPESPKVRVQGGLRGPNGQPVTAGINETTGEQVWSAPEYVAPKAGPSDAQILANEMARLRIDAERAKQQQAVTDREKQAGQAAESTQAALDSVDKLLDKRGLGANLGSAYGAYEMRGWTQGAQDFKAERDRLAAMLTLPNLGTLKGPMSDKDLAFLKQVSTTLSNDNISDEAALGELTRVQQWLRSKGAVSGGGAADGDAAAKAKALIDKYGGGGR